MSTQSGIVAVDPLALYPGAVRCLGRRPDGGEGVHYRPFAPFAGREPDYRERSAERRMPLCGPVLFPGEEADYSVGAVEPIVVPALVPRWWGWRQERAASRLWSNWQDVVRVEAALAADGRCHVALPRATSDREAGERASRLVEILEALDQARRELVEVERAMREYGDTERRRAAEAEEAEDPTTRVCKRCCGEVVAERGERFCTSCGWSSVRELRDFRDAARDARESRMADNYRRSLR